MRPVNVIESPVIVLPDSNIDTDQIIPARFLTTTQREGIGEHAFEDWRRNDDGSLRDDCPINDPRAKAAQIIVAGRNFGCGSSREHAPWALVDMGVRAVISASVADIFRSNALKNGLVPCVVDEAFAAEMLKRPWQTARVDVERGTVSCEGLGETTFPLDGFSRYCLLKGFDQLDFLLDQTAAIETYERDAGKLAGLTGATA